MASLCKGGLAILMGIGAVAMLAVSLTAAPIMDASPATVVYKVDGRIYLSMGRLDGLTGSWTVSKLPGGVDASRVPITWIGDDLCRVEPVAFVYDQMKIGDTLWLTRVVPFDSEPVGTSVRWAVTELPTPIRDAPVTWSDWDFREAVYTHIGETVDSISEDESGNCVFHLWPEAELRFSNGRPLRSDAIRESLRALCTDWTPFSVWMEHFRNIEDTLIVAKSNEFKIETNFSCRCGRKLSFIDSPGFYAVDISGEDSISALYGCGAGAYAVVSVDDSDVTLAKQSGTFDPASVDTVIYTAYDSYDDAKLAFELGEADIVEIAPYDVAKFDDSYEVIAHDVDADVFLSVNNSKPYFADNLFATALNYLIDKESLCRVPLGRMVEPLNIPGLVDDSNMTATFSYDRRKGRRLLQQIDNLPEFMSLLLTDPSDLTLARTAEYIRGTLERENIHLTIYTSPFTSDTTKIDDLFETFDLMLARLDDPSGIRAPLLYQSYFHPGTNNTRLNRSLYHSDEIDRQFRDYYTGCFDGQGGDAEAGRRIITTHLHAPSGVWLYRPVRYLAVSSKVLSVNFTESGIVDLKRIEVEQQ